VKPRNFRTDRVDRRLWQNRSGERRSVVIIRERNDRSVPSRVQVRGPGGFVLRAWIEPGTIADADDARVERSSRPL
jgi:hypothetical protein